MENNKVLLLLLCVIILMTRTDAIFTCRTTGKFPDLTDLSCKKYFHCKRTIIGGLWATTFRCDDSNFDANTQTCSTTYPCSTAPTSTDFLNFFPGQFRCTSSGLFPDSEDSSCRRYYHCVRLFGFIFRKVKYNCQNSLFDPVLRECSETYDCQKNEKPPVSTQFNSTSMEELLDTNVSTGQYSNDVLIEISTIVSSEEAVNTAEYNEDNEQDDDKTSFELNTAVTSPEESLESTTGVTTIRTTSRSYDNVGTTVQYTSLCEDLSATSFTTNSPLDTSTEQSTLSIAVTENKFDGFTCTIAGRFPDLQDKTCSRYFLCSNLSNGTVLKTTYHCPNSCFDPFWKRCSKLYQCEWEKTTAPNLSVTEILSSTEYDLHLNSETNTETEQTEIEGSILTTSVNNIEEFACSEVGKFPDLSDRTCQKYYHCSKLKDGTFVQTTHVCPNSNHPFDPVLQKCSKYYDCPQDQSTATSVITTMFKSTEIQMHTTENFVSEPSPMEYDFQCSQTGRFPDLKDFTCKCYFLCNKLRNGTFVQTPYQCPSNSIFDPLGQLCSMRTACRYQISYTM